MTRRGMTLVEMMVATTMSLIILGIVAQLFGMLGKGVSASRSTLTLSEQLRAVGNTLRTDLAGLTVPTVPPASPDSDAGYLEIIEGPNTDDPGDANRMISLTGDCDDALLLTTRSLGNPFVGRFDNGSIESQYAEVAWFCRPSPSQPVTGSTLFTLYRRQLLVMGYVGAGAFAGSNSIGGALPADYAEYDLSLRADGSGTLFPNSLGDLTKRENRFLHNLGGIVNDSLYPYDDFTANLATNGVLTGTREGEDIVLTNVLAFDVRVFDPDAPVRNAAGQVAVIPGDPGYLSAAGTAAEGAYIDLGLDGGAPIAMNATFPPAGSSALLSAGMRVTANKFLTRTYDTGSLHYEFNGIDEDGVGGIDQGTNGRDDNSDGVIDDAAERETSPPYPVPLRGLEVRIRCYEPESRQVRQITIRHSFVPH